MVENKQVGEIDATDAEICICAYPLHHILYMMNGIRVECFCTDHMETVSVRVIFFADEPDSYFDSQ